MQRELAAELGAQGTCYRDFRDLVEKIDARLAQTVND